MHEVIRYHDISCGHRVVGHEGKCRFLHGHNYRIHFTCVAEKLDNVGRVVDFGVIKEKLCMWLEDNWDHKFLFWEQDSVLKALSKSMECGVNMNSPIDEYKIIGGSIIDVPFNPTAENIAQYLVDTIGPQQLKGTGVTLIKCLVEETAKCSASYIKSEIILGESIEN